MDEKRLEQELKEHFKAEVKKVEPSNEWWNNALSRVDKERRSLHTEKPGFWKLRPSLIAIPLSIFLLVVLVGSFIPMLGGMAPPPPPAPITISDQDGGAFLVWLDKPYHQYEAIVRAQHVDAQGNRLWGENGKQIASDASLNGAVRDGMGGMIVTWRKGYGSSLERLDPAGNTVWKLENLWVSENTSWSVMGMTEDGSGGVIILLYDRNDRIYAQRVGSDGAILWGQENVLIDTIRDISAGASVTGDGQGGAVIVWHTKNGSSITIQAQRLSPGGETLWGDKGVAIATISGGQGGHEKVISDGTGNYAVVWDTEAGMSGAPDTDVYIQKLDGDGNSLWGDRGILVCQDQVAESFSPADDQSQPQVVADGTGGEIVTWRDRRRILNSEIFAQRISSTGAALWTENGVWLWNISANYPRTAGVLDSSIISDGNGGAIIVWTGYDAQMWNSVIYAQKLSSDGQRLWPTEKVYSNSVFQSQGNSGIVSDEKGGIIIGSRVGEASGISRTDSVYAQKIDSTGNRIWGESGLEIEKIHSALTVQFIAIGAILAAMLVLIGVIRRNKIAGVLTAVLPVLLGIAGLFSVLLVIGPFGYTYGWAYIPDTPINKIAAFIVPLASLAISAMGIRKKTVTRWVLIPVTVFCALVTVIALLALVL